jgi:Ni/Co efflux regulator RcnB
MQQKLTGDVMRKSLWVVAAVALLGSSAAMAQDQGGRPDDRNARPRPEQPSARPPGRPDQDARPPANRPPVNRPPAHRPPASRPPVNRPPYVGRRPPHRFLSGGAWRHSLHGPAYRYPPGFSYRVWATGAILPSVFLSSSYFYDDYATLGLAPPPPGYRWVRYGPDLLMVNVVTGRVADSVDGVFY